MSLLLALLLGCQPLPTGGCGLAPYDWVGRQDLGEIVSWEYVEDLSFTAEQIQGLLEPQGITSLSPIPYDVRTFRVRYATQDRGERIEATAWLAFPAVDEPTRFPTALWLHGSMGFDDACAPTASDTYIDVLPTVLVASQGFATAAPDYLGLAGWGPPSERLHPLAHPESAAVVSLDAVRALWSFSEARLDDANPATADKRVVPWGVSEGGFTALWVDRYAARYLPSARIVAGVAAVPPTDLLGLAEVATTTFGGASEQLAAILVTHHDWYRGDEPLTEVLSASMAASLPDTLQSGCSDTGWFEDLDALEDAFAPTFLASASTGAWEDLDPWSCYLEKATLHQSEIPRRQDAPFLFVVAEEDEIVPPEVTRADVGRLCDLGYRLDYVECRGADHSAGVLLPVPLEVRWLQDRLADEPLPDDLCVLRAPVACETFAVAE